MHTMYKLVVGVFLLVLVAGGGWWAYNRQSSDDLVALSASGGKPNDAQVQALVARIGKFMVVPADETPSATVLRDVQTLAQQQPFYHDAKDGDFLVIYSSRAIIYDPNANKLVNVGPIVRNDMPPASPSPVASGSSSLPSPSGTPAVPEKITVDVRNGTGTAGVAKAMAETLKKNTWVTIGTVGDAKGSYGAITLVDVSGGKKPNAIAALEKIFGVKAVTAIPKGESASKADVLVIVGK